MNRPANIIGAADHAAPRPRRRDAPNAAPIQIDAAEHNRPPAPTGETGASNLSTIGAARIAPCDRAEPQSGGAAAPQAPTYSRCPDCNGPFSYRIRDDDTGCAYPVDDGEHYCNQCCSLWTDEYLATGWLRAELSHSIGGEA